MGTVQSANDDIDDFVDYLVANNYISSPLIEKVFRAVDRANYYHPKYRDKAYRDVAWKYGHFHLSAPNIYCKVMEALKLERGLSFLNLGSGTGYLSTIAGLILGPYGINHGIELHNDCVQCAFDRLDEFKLKSEMFGEFEFCEPKFVVGNCLQLTPGGRLYDRVYCGAACPVEYENYMKNLINVGGILVMPVNDKLLQIRRTSETRWETKNIDSAQFEPLILPSLEGHGENTDLPEFMLPSLQDVSRFAIRSILHKKTLEEYPNLKNNNRTEREASRHVRNQSQKEILTRFFDDDWDTTSALSTNEIANRSSTINRQEHSNEVSDAAENTNSAGENPLFINPNSLRHRLLATGLLSAGTDTPGTSNVNTILDHPEAYSIFWGKVRGYVHEVPGNNLRGTISMHLQEDIKLLPLPVPLRSYLMYYRA